MNDKLVPIEHDGQRVITTELLAQVYETDTNNITQNFKRNKDRFKPGLHYFLLQGKDLDEFRLQVTDSHLQISPMTRSLYLWTERGANRHCKILDTPKAWEQFDNLEETYFMVKEQRKATSPSEIKSILAAAGVEGVTAPKRVVHQPGRSKGPRRARAGADSGGVCL